MPNICRIRCAGLAVTEARSVDLINFIFPNHLKVYNLTFDVKDKNGESLPKGTKFILKNETLKTRIYGQLSNDGLVKINSLEPYKYSIHVMFY